MKKAIVVGSGIAGMAVAIRLACRGYSLEVFEAAEGPGGKLGSFQIGNYRFDKGPSLFTMPGFVEELFQLAGEDPSAYFSYEKIPVACHYFWDDGSFLRAFGEPELFSIEAEKVTGIPSDKIRSYLEHSRLLYENTGRIFLDRSLHLAASYFRKDILRALLNLPVKALTKTLDSFNKDWLGNEKMRQLFNRYATYNGSDPYQAPAMLSLIPHFEFNVGTYLPKGGMYDITEALYRLALRKKVQFRFGSPVDRIMVEKSRATGIMAGGEFHKADIVVSNMDITPTYRRLLPEHPAPEKTLAQPRSSSAMIFYWGIRGSFPQLHLHNIFFSKNYREEFSSIFREKGIYHDPTIYINITSKYVEGDAPPGCENWFILVNVPPDEGSDWKERTREIRRAVLEKLKRILGTDIEPLIEAEQTWDPPGIQADTSSWQGALYGTSSNTRMAAFLRHPNFSSAIRNLYFCGGSVHPGGGIPLCLQSAKITSELVHRNQ